MCMQPESDPPRYYTSRVVAHPLESSSFSNKPNHRQYVVVPIFAPENSIRIEHKNENHLAGEWYGLVWDWLWNLLWNLARNLVWDLIWDLVWDLVWNLIWDLVWDWFEKNSESYSWRIPNRQIPKNRALTRKYYDQIDFLQKPWNHPMVILSILYDGDDLESIFKSGFFQIKFSQKLKHKKVQNWQTSKFAE